MAWGGVDGLRGWGELLVGWVVGGAICSFLLDPRILLSDTYMPLFTHPTQSNPIQTHTKTSGEAARGHGRAGDSGRGHPAHPGDRAGAQGLGV